jgi:hypothetical protein
MVPKILRGETERMRIVNGRLAPFRFDFPWAVELRNLDKTCGGFSKSSMKFFRNGCRVRTVYADRNLAVELQSLSSPV